MSFVSSNASVQLKLKLFFLPQINSIVYMRAADLMAETVKISAFCDAIPHSYLIIYKATWYYIPEEC